MLELELSILELLELLYSSELLELLELYPTELLLELLLPGHAITPAYVSSGRTVPLYSTEPVSPPTTEPPESLYTMVKTTVDATPEVNAPDIVLLPDVPVKVAAPPTTDTDIDHVHSGTIYSFPFGK